MRISKFSLLASIIVVFTLSSSFGSVDEEPIPDFGPEGPVGFESKELKQDSTPFGRGQMRVRGRVEAMQMLRLALSKLDLTMAQHSEIKAVIEKHAEKGAQLRIEMTGLQDTVKAARSGAGDEASFEKARNELVAFSEKDRTLQAELLQSVMNVLTVEQKRKFNQIQAQMRQRSNRRNKTWKPVL